MSTFEFDREREFSLRSRIKRSGRTPVNALLPGVILVFFVVAWEVSVRFYGIPVYVLPAPSQIVGALATNYQPIGRELQVSLSAFAIAFLMTAVTGYLSALAMYQWHVVETIFYPYVITARAIPIVSLIPIFIIWFGFGFNSVVIISFLISFFAMVVNSLSGFKSTDDDLRDMLRSFSASRWEIFRNVHMYASLPSVFAGLKICVILSFTGVIIGEFLIGTAGIGYLIIEYNNNLATTKMFAGVLAISVVQLLLFGTVVAIERTIVDWV